MNKKLFKTEVRRINGHLKELITFLDSSGNPIGQAMNPIMVELKPRDIIQIFAGSLFIAAPLSFTEEVWVISAELGAINVFLLWSCSLITVVLFVFYNFYRASLKGHVIEFIKRIIAIYLISIFSVVLILSLIDKFPIVSETEIAVKRVLIIGFPAVFGGTLSDFLK